MAVALTLVHSPLVGLATWDVLAAALIDRGREVWIPDLTRSVSDGPTYLAGQVDRRSLRSWTGGPTPTPPSTGCHLRTTNPIESTFATVRLR